MKTRRSSCFRNLLAISLHSLIAVMSYTHAQTVLTWDADPNTSGVQDGNGVWDSTVTNWWNGTSNVSWTSGALAVFGSGAGSAGNYAITVGSDLAVGTTASASDVMRFNTPGNYTISAESARVITLSSSGQNIGSIRLQSGVTATIGQNITIRRASATTNGQINIWGGATAGQTNGGTFVIGTGVVGSTALVENLSTGNLNELRQGATLEIKTGGRYNSGSSFVLGGVTNPDNGFTNTLHINGGRMDIASNNLILGSTVNGNSTGNTANVRLSSGEINVNASTGTVRFGTALSGTVNNIINATFDLDGGRLTTGRILDAGGTGTINSTFNFNGGELRVLATTTNAASFISNLDVARVRNGGAKIHTNGINTTIGQALVRSDLVGDAAIDGGLEKLGAGSLTLTGANTYTGSTRVREGSVILGGGNDRLATTGSVILGDTSTSGRLVLGDGTARNQTLGGLTTTGLGGSVVGGAATNSTLSLNIASGTNTFGGTIGGSNANENNLAITKSGDGKLVLSGANTYTGATTISAGSLHVNGSLNSSSIVVEGNGTLGGSGVLTGATLSGSGMVAPGNSPGILTTSTVDVRGGLDFSFEFSAATPTFSNSAASANDVLRIVGGTPFIGLMDLNNIVNIYLNVDSLTGGHTFAGGFFTDTNQSFSQVLQNAQFQFFLKSASGSVYEGNTYALYQGPLTFEVNTVQQAANFGAGDITGQIMQITVVPETSVTLLGGLSALLMLRRRRMH